MILEGIPIEFCAQIIEQYIYAMKGVQVRIKLPIPQHEEEKFITALNIAMYKLNVNIQ